MKLFQGPSWNFGGTRDLPVRAVNEPSESAGVLPAITTASSLPPSACITYSPSVLLPRSKSVLLVVFSHTALPLVLTKKGTGMYVVSLPFGNLLKGPQDHPPSSHQQYAVLPR